MSLLPFEPKPPAREPRSTAAAPSQPEPPLTVSQLAACIKSVVTRGFTQRVRVVGQISNFSNRTHWFFSLKDDAATLRCVCFASAAGRVRFRVADGMEVVATGRLDYFEAGGQLQLYVDRLEPVGIGELELRFRQLCATLRAAGYFDEARKKPLPLLPRAVAIVTSRGGAALQDLLNTARRRWGGCRLVLVDVRVQGPSAAPQIAAAIAALSRHGAAMGIDAIILTRGGGSIEDLWAFNERAVADAIHRCRLPVVAAIGHETDTTIAELVADLRCSTPTQAAMRVVPDAAALGGQLDQIHRRLTMLARRGAQSARQRLDAAAGRAMFRRPQLMAEPHRRRLTELARRLAAGLPQRLAAARQMLDARARQLEAVGPMNVLQRGYSYTLGPDGQVLRSTAAVAAGQRITTLLVDGRLTSRVEEGAHQHPEAPGAEPPRRQPRRSPRRQPRKATDAAQNSLFG
jgi:exodeoxyribonuclease VII large subunit